MKNQDIEKNFMIYVGSKKFVIFLSNRLNHLVKSIGLTL